MRIPVITAAQTALFAAAFAGLVAGCGHSSTTTAAPTLPSSGLAAMSTDCQTYTTLLQSSSTALTSHDASQLEKSAAQDDAAAATISNPKLKEAVEKLSQFNKQQAAYKQNPSSSNIPDSKLMNTSDNDFADACIPK